VHLAAIAGRVRESGEGRARHRHRLAARQSVEDEPLAKGIELLDGVESASATQPGSSGYSARRTHTPSGRRTEAISMV
jgi:hypothetical protein